MGDGIFSIKGRLVDESYEMPLSARRSAVSESNRNLDDGTSHLSFWALLRHHLRDWLVILLCILMDTILNIIDPFNRYVGLYNIDSLMYPLNKNTVPPWAVPIIAILIPLTVFGGYFIKRKDTRDFHHALLGLLTAVGFTAVFTDALKDGVGRARPDFYWRCFPDGLPNYDSESWEVLCDGDPETIREGYKSFPSGHTSWSFSGLGYLSFYLAGKLTLFDRRGHSSRLLIVFFPLLAASLVAVSRVSDYWHHWQDVTVGGLLGLSIAYFSYKQHFPELSEKFAGYPYGDIHGSSSLTYASHNNPAAWASSHQGHSNSSGPHILERVQV